MSITEINLGQLLKPISKDNPIGDDVERLDISGLRHMAEGTPKTQFSLMSHRTGETSTEHHKNTLNKAKTCGLFII